MNNKKEDFGLPISSILVVMTIFGVIWFSDSPLKGIRPTTDKIGEQPFSRTQDVPARLWQDPFNVVRKHGDDSAHDISQTKIMEKIKAVNGLIILGVMVVGGPYAEDAEWRLRMRYATVSALGRLNYQPEDGQHIGYFNFPLDKTSDAGKKQLEFKIDIEPNLNDDKKQPKFEWNISNPDEMQSLCVPFEWFKKEEPFPAILLLWLNDDAFDKDPLQRLSRLVKLIKEEINKQKQIHININIKTFGPAGSTTLKTMIEEVKRNETENSFLKDLNNVQIYSPFATAADQHLLYPDVGENISKYFKEKIEFIRTIGNDKNLLQSTIKELKLRKVDLIADEKCHIAIIGEWDTFYSRTMRRNFIDLLRREYKQVEDRIHFFSYLRGIDGQLPGEIQQKPGEAEREGQSRGNKEDSENNDMYRPTGCNQYDYLLRLARQTQTINEDLRRNNKGEIKAIGVLGNDVYDKLLVLRAMRQQFPTAVFFTTDLDACLLQPSEFKWARNLIVASNFGLRLHDELQGDIPAFRDNYQTSLFFSILLALSQNKIFEEGKRPAQDFINKYLIPRIFEVGRNGAVDVSQQSNTGMNLVIDGTHIPDIHPPSEVFDTSFCPKDKVKYLWLSIFLVLGLIYISSDTFKDFTKTYFLNYKNRYLMCVIISVIFIGFGLWYVVKDTLFKEEPFSLFDGISIWPTEIIRFLSALLAVFFLFKSNININESNQDIMKDFNFPNEDDTDEVRKSKTPISLVAKLFPFWWRKVEEKDIGGKL
ncbi:MAG: hypothetical protein FJ264_16490 [Planctomycetes bacterium]|nr:hypothetical protein [Planctomycetota bacterium]